MCQSPTDEMQLGKDADSGTGHGDADRSKGLHASCSCSSELPLHATPLEHDNVPWHKHVRRFMKFVGPTWLVAIMFVDPGGITAALQQGSTTQFALLWCSWWSIGFGYVFQILAARIGIVSGRPLAKLCVENYDSLFLRWVLWFFIEGSVFGDDIQACIGSTIALQIMTGLPWWSCVLLTTAVSMILTILYFWRSRHIETAVGVMMFAMMALVFVNVGHGDANAGQVIKGWVVPTIPDGQVLTVVGSVGGVLTPSAVYLGSYMVLSRPVNRTSKRDVNRCLVYSLIELLLGWIVAFLIILAITITFANGFYSPDCASQGLAYIPDEGQCDSIALGYGPQALESLYGAAAKWVFAFTLLMSGVNSMVTATVAAQVTWEGFGFGMESLKSSAGLWIRILITRCLVLVPTLTISLTKGNDDVIFTIINDWINIFMSLAMPMAVIPCLHMASLPRFMGDMALRPLRMGATIVATLGLIAINFYLLSGFLFQPDNFSSGGAFPDTATFYAFIGALWAVYVYLLVQVARPGLTDIWRWFRDSSWGSSLLARCRLWQTARIPSMEGMVSDVK